HRARSPPRCAARWRRTSFPSGRRSERSAAAMRAGLAERIRARGEALGFERIGFSAAGRSPRSEALRRWIAHGYAGSMAYMEKDVEGRADPTRRSPWARTIVSAAVHYAPPPGPADRAARSAGPGIAPFVSGYAVGDDYHDVLRARLDDL